MDDRKARLKSVRDYMPREFTCETYARQFHTLLHVEEHKAAYVTRKEEEHVTHQFFLGWIFNDTMKKQLHWSRLQGTSTSAPK